MSTVHDRIGTAPVGNSTSSSQNNLVQLTGTYDIAPGINKQDVVDILALRNPKARCAAKIAAWAFLEDQINRELVQASALSSQSPFSTLRRKQCTVTDKDIVPLMRALSSSLSSEDGDSDADGLETLKNVLLPNLTLCKTSYISPQAFIVCKDNMSFILAAHFDLLCETIPFFIRALAFLAFDRFDILVYSSQPNDLKAKHAGLVTQQTLARAKVFLSEMHVLYGIMGSDCSNTMIDDNLAGQRALAALTNCNGDPLHKMFLQSEPHFLEK